MVDGDIGGHQGLGSQRHGLTDARAHRALRPLGQIEAELVGGPAAHGGAGDHVLGHRLFDEARRRDHLHRAGVHVGLRHHAAGAAEMVGMAVGVDQGADLALAQGLVDQVEGRLRRLGGGETVDDDPAGLAADEGGIGHIEAPDLPDSVGDLEDPVLRQELAVPPEAGVHRRRGRTLHEVIGRQVPHHPAVGGGDLRILAGGDEAPVGKVEVPCVRPVGRRLLRGAGGLNDREGRGREGQAEVGAAHGVSSLGCLLIVGRELRRRAGAGSRACLRRQTVVSRPRATLPQRRAVHL